MTATEPAILVLVRHGQCIANVQRKFAGSDEDDHLTDQGRLEARAAGVAVAQLLTFPGVDRSTLLSSDLLRARQTLEEMVPSLPSVPIYGPDARFRERGDGEPTEELLLRVDSGLAERSRDGARCAILVTHGHVVQCLVARACGMPFPGALEPWNGGITILKDGRLVAYNLLSHLIGLHVVA